MFEQVRRRHGFSGRFVPCCVLFVMVVLAAVSAGAQSISSGTIHGTITDESGATLPGVTVTLKGPALLVDMVQVTAPDGEYRFVDLPVGTYSVESALTGFGRVVRTDLPITVGFVARIDLTMTVSALEETVTVSGQAPVVDLTTTTRGVSITKDVLDAAPRGRGLFEVFYMAPGITGAEKPDVGDSQLADRQNVEAYGVSSQPTMQVDGINIATSGQASSAVYMTTFGFEEVSIKSSGNDAEVGTPGMSMVAVLKSGSNTFHGTYAGAFQRPEMQSNNLTDSLRAQGLSATEPLKFYYEFGADLGGPIVRNKLWFYASASQQERYSGIVGFAADPGADGLYLTADDTPGEYGSLLRSFVAKATYQVSAKNKLTASWTPGLKFLDSSGGGRFRPLENVTIKDQPILGARAELQSMVTPRVLINAVVGYNGYQADDNVARSGFLRPDFPSRLDRETGLRTGPAEMGRLVPSRRKEVNGSISFFPERFLGGSHEMKAGTAIYLESGGVTRESLSNGNYLLTFDRVSNVSGTGVEIKINNYPVTPKNAADVAAVYFKDTWRISNNLSANFGVRWQRDHSYLPAQVKEASPLFPGLFPAGDFPKRDLLTWNAVMPRAGLAWSFNSKTVAKATYGIFADTIGEGFGAIYNPNAEASAVFRWRDTDRNGNYTPGETNLNLNGPDFISITAASNNIFNPDLRQPKMNEFTASLERELVQNLGVRVLYLFKKRTDAYGVLNVLRPYDAFNIPLTRRDPGPDGVLSTADDGGKVTIYDYSPAFAGAAFVGNERVNSDNADSWNSIEVTMTKRTAGRWAALASFWAIKSNEWISPVIPTPNDAVFPKNETWQWAFTSNGSYRMPGDVMLAAFFQARAGDASARTNIFRAADPDGGPSLRQLNSVTLRVEPIGASRTPPIRLANVKASKRFSLGSRQKLALEFEVFNVFNAGTPTAVNYASGTTFGYATGVVGSRIARIGARFDF